MIVFSVSAIEKAPVTLRGVLEKEFMTLDGGDSFAITGGMEYELTARKVSGGILVSGACHAPVHTTCGRCLKEFDFELELPDAQMFFEIDPGVEELDVSEDVRAELLLELPMNPLCHESCRGLCPVCGIDRNEADCSCETEEGAQKVSPWSALDDLKLD